MPGPLLHQGAQLVCMHTGPAQPVVVNPRVRVSGQPTVTLQSSYAVAGCALSGTSNPPCASAQWVMGATRVFSSKVPLLLQDSQAVCTPTGTGLQVVQCQLRVRGT